MFKFLKEKLGKWTKKLTQDAEEVVETSEKKEVKEIPIPMKFNAGAKKYEPNLDTVKGILKQKSEKIKKEVHFEPSLDKQLRGETIGKNLKEQSKPGEKGFFKKITSKIKKIKISEKEFEIYAEELEMLLLENNVALEVAEKVVQELKEKIVDKEFLKKEAEEEIKDTFKNILREILVNPFLLEEKIRLGKKKPYVVLFCGINGTGKTTTIAKIADSLKRKNISCVLAAADTFRAASIEQIKKHGEKLNIPVVANEYGSDPASVGFDAIQHAKKNKINCVLIDTAGRIHTSKNLLKEIEKISRVCKPDTTIFIGESITGNDAIEQAKTFDWEIGIDGIILTKADIDKKGGTALSVGYVLKKPILYLGTGQEYDKIEPFNKEKFLKSLGL